MRVALSQKIPVGIKFIIARGWSAIVATAASIFLISYTRLPIWAIVTVVIIIIGVGLWMERQRHSKERIKELADDLARQQSYFLETFLPLSDSEARYSLFHVIRLLPALVTDNAQREFLRGWENAMHHAANVLRDLAESRIETFGVYRDIGITRNALATQFEGFFRLVVRYHHCAEDLRNIVERVIRDADKSTVDAKRAQEELKSRYSDFRTAYNALAQNLQKYVSDLAKENLSTRPLQSIEFIKELQV